MIIRRIEIENFKRLLRFKAEFGPGVNVISGPNESGKSTLVEAILACLFAKVSSQSRERARMLSWGVSNAPRLVLEIESGEGAASIEKDFEKKKTRVTAPAGSITAVKEVESWIAELTGVSSDDMYCATACVREEDIKPPSLSDGGACSLEIAERLQAMLTGAAGGSPSQVIRRLKKEYDGIRKKPTSADPDGGPVAARSKELNLIREKLARQKREMLEYERAAGERANAESRLEAVEKDLAAHRDVVEKHRQYIKQTEEKKRLSDRLNLLSKARGLTDELDKVKKSLEEFSGYENKAKAAARLGELREVRFEKETVLNQLGADKYRHKPEPGKGYYIALAAGGIVVLIGFLLAAVLREPWALIGLAASAPAFGAAFYLRGGEDRKERKRVAELDRRIRTEEAALEKINTEIDGLVREFDRTSVEQSLEAFHGYQSLAGEEKTLKERIEDLAAGLDAEDLQRELNETAAFLSLARESLSKNQSYRIDDPLKLSALENTLTRLEEEREELVKRMMLAEGRMSAPDFDREEMAALEEVEAEAEERLKFHERKLRVHEKALTVLSESATAITGKAGRLIEDEVAPMMAEVTEGRYDRVQADASLSLSVFSAAKNDWVEEDDLSLATREQLQLAARLALVKLVLGGKRPPLILDDPFAHFDDQRLAAAMKVVATAAREHQVIVIAPNGRYSSFADRTIPMDSGKE